MLSIATKKKNTPCLPLLVEEKLVWQATKIKLGFRCTFPHPATLTHFKAAVSLSLSLSLAFSSVQHRPTLVHPGQTGPILTCSFSVD